MIKIHNTDAIKWAEDYDGPLFHALFCDAPYHLTTITKRFGKDGAAPAKHGKDGAFGRLSKGFMGQLWDGGDIAFQPETWSAFMRVLYPGAFGMAFAGSRGWHRMAVAIEDAGFIIHPTIFLWAYGSGFPKATRVDTQIDKGKERKVIGKKKLWGHNAGSGAGSFSKNQYEGQTGVVRYEDITEPASDLSKAWEGHRYGMQAMKPAVEPIILFQKPYQGKPLDNITETGAGTINIDGSRIGSDDININRWTDSAHPFGDGAGNEYESVTVKGRWPANFLLDEEAARRLDEQTGELTSGEPVGVRHSQNQNIYGKVQLGKPISGYGDSGGASRFFFNVREKLDAADPVYYCGKASPDERTAGLDENNPHPTVKPLDLCRHLAGLLLPPGKYAPRRLVVPFSGVGSECIGAHLAGWDEIEGIESDTKNGYVDIAQKRIKHWTSKPVALDLFTGKGV